MATELKTVRQQLTDLRRQMTGMERDNRLLSIMSENADRLRRTNEADKKLQYLYNDMLLAYCPNLVFLFDKDLKLQLATRSCLSILPFGGLEDMKMRTPEQLFSSKMDAEWIAKITGECREAMESRKTRQYNDRITFIDGAGYMDTQTDVSPIVDEESGLLRGVLVSLNDITELSVTKERAEDASRSKSSFMANMIHEISTPMNAIKGLAELLMMTDLGDVQQAYVSNIINSSNLLLTITNDILDFSKIDANRIDILKSEYNLSTILKDVCSLISLRAMEKDLELVVKIDPALPDKLYGDDSRLKQVMLNVLGNAVKYTDKGKIAFAVGGERLGEGNIRLDFTVTDTGIGIRHDEMSTLFEAFSRADLNLDRRVVGTGLGLAISKNLMLAMNGDISVKSTYGKGSTFSFWLPQTIVAGAPLASVDHADKKKVLILDDGKRGKELASFLEQLGVPHVHIKNTIRQALPGWEDASHCVYYDGHDQTELGKLRGSMPETAFVVIRDIRRALEPPKYADMSVYEPLLLTDLAAALNSNRSSAINKGRDGSAETGGSFKVREAKALFVDDNALNLMVGGELVRAFGFTVIEASSGPDAIKICREQKFDIIFMDHLMPAMDGIEAAKHIREAPGLNSKTPIIVLTANVVGGMKDHFLRCGMDDMVSKPIDVADLARAITAWVPAGKLFKADGSSVPKVEDVQAVPGFDLVKLLDEFGMYAGDVMRELDGDLQTYINRLRQAGMGLGDLVRYLNELVRLEDWPGFSRVIGELKEMLHGVGARDCAVRAKKMEIAAVEDNIAYVHQDFKSLMGNMYMLERKLDALVPLAMGKKKEGYTPNDPVKIYSLLQDLQITLGKRDLGTSTEIMEELARCSFDHDLDMLLNSVRWAMEVGAFEEAASHNITAVAFHKQKNAIT